jgi:hypothetical protein
MNCILWYDGQRRCGKVWIQGDREAELLAQALAAHGWKVVWTIHTTDAVCSAPGYESALKRWQEVEV